MEVGINRGVISGCSMYNITWIILEVLPMIYRLVIVRIYVIIWVGVGCELQGWRMSHMCMFKFANGRRMWLCTDLIYHGLLRLA